jgi:hypothetical protein
MAAAIIPIISAAVSAVSPLLPSIVQLMEQAFGPKTGETKLEIATDIANKIVQQMATAGKLEGAAPQDLSYLQGAIEQVVQWMKASGQLADTGSAVGPQNPTSPGVPNAGSAILSSPVALKGALYLIG